MDAADIIEVRLDRGACFGTCPSFRFTASRHGGYRYEGHCYIEPLGERSGRLPGYLFGRLAEVCVELRVLELDDVYPTDFEDTSSTAVTVRHAGGTKVVRDDGGTASPARLWAFAQLIEVVMRQVFAAEALRRS